MNLRYHLDANVLLRFMRDDDRVQSPASARLFASAKAGKVRLAVSAVTVAEVFYVLARGYRLPKTEAAAKLLAITQSDILEVENRDRIHDALQRVIAANVDFGDAYLAATAAASNEAAAAFDGDLDAFTDITTVVPT